MCIRGANTVLALMLLIILSTAIVLRCTASSGRAFEKRGSHQLLQEIRKNLWMIVLDDLSTFSL